MAAAASVTAVDYRVRLDLVVTGGNCYLAHEGRPIESGSMLHLEDIPTYLVTLCRLQGPTCTARYLVEEDGRPLVVFGPMRRILLKSLVGRGIVFYSTSHRSATRSLSALS